jgi:hypothetical protein
VPERRWPWKGLASLPDRRPDEELWEWARRVARDVMHLAVPDEAEQEPGPPRPRQVRPYTERLHEIYRREPREPGEDDA